MKVVLFADGKAGEIKTLPGERPLTEIWGLLSDTYENEPDMIRLRDKLWLCAILEEPDQATRYAYKKPGREVEEINGPCVVVWREENGRLKDMTKDDLDRANELVWPVRE